MAPTNIPNIRIDISDSRFVSCQPGGASNSVHHRLRARNKPIASPVFQSSLLLGETPNSSSSSLSSSLRSDGSFSLSSSSSSTTDSCFASSVEETYVSHSQYSRIPPTAIVSLVNLLDAFDADVELQVAHAKENIKELRELMDLYKKERAEKIKRILEKKEQVERETKGADSDFWSCI